MADKSDKQDNATSGGQWYLQKQDGSEYGPEDIDTMARWATESRIVSGNKLSQDRKEWIPVEDISELAMDWQADLPDGRKYGPFNIEATRDLVAHKVLPREATLQNRHTEEGMTVEEYLNGPHSGDDAETTQEDEVSETAETEIPEEKDITPDTPQDAVTTETEAEDVSPTPQLEKKKAAKKRSTKKKADETMEKDLFGSLDSADKEVDEIEKEPKESKADETLGDVVDVGDVFADESVDTEPKNTDDLDNQVQILNTRIESLKKRLAESEKERRATTRHLKEIQENFSKLESERNGAKKTAVTQDSQLNNKLTVLESELQKKDDQIQEITQTATDLDQRLNAAMGELKKARNGEVKSTEALKTVEAQLARKTAIQDKRVQDLEAERNTLAQMVETGASQVKRLKVLVVALVAAAIVLCGMFLMRGCFRGGEPAAAPPDADQAATLDKAPRVATTIDETEPVPVEEEAPHDASVGRTRRSALPFPDIRSVKGAQVTYSRAGSSVVFDEGVFTKDTEMTSEAKALLRSIAVQIRPFLRDYELLVEGHTDNQRMRSSATYRNNTELGQERARVVARFFSQSCGVPLSSMRAISAGSSNPPYPNDTQENRVRNRTIVLRLQRHADH